MSGLFAIFHVLRLVLEMVGKIVDQIEVEKIRRRTEDEFRLRSRVLLDKARAARSRSFSSSRRHRHDSDSERLHKDDGYRRD